MEEDIQGWLDCTLENSRIQWEYMQTREDDPDGWGDIFDASLQECCSDISGCGILLTGADGYSKQSAAIQMLSLLQSEAYEGVFLDGMELGACGTVQAKARLNGLFDRFYDMGKGLCLILEGMEECPCRRELLCFLGQELCKYRVLREEYTPLFLILMDDREHDLPGLLRERLRLCRMSLPDRNRRAAYLEKYARSLRNFLSLELFAQATEGASYAQLHDMISIAGCLVDSRDGQALSDEELTAFLAGQMPAPAPEDTMQKLCQSAQQLVEQLPQVLKDVTAIHQASPAAYSPVQTRQATPQMPVVADQGSFLENKRREIEQMTPWELAVDLFGEEDAEKLRRPMVDMQ